MKYILYLSLVVLVFSCAEKTEETSKYNSLITTLNESNSKLETSYQEFSEIDNDTLTAIMNQATIKLNAVKSVYKSDTIEANFEDIILKARGGLFKTIRKYLIDYGNSEEEYEYTTKQYETLKQNLIHEKLTKSEAENYTHDENNSILVLNEKLIGLTHKANESFSLHQNVFLQLDSIYNVHANK